MTIISAPNAAPIRNLYTTTPQLAWGSLTWATGYEIQVATDSKFNDLVFSQVTDADTLAVTLDDPLSNGVYYWRVRAQQQNGKWGKWTAAEPFTFVAE